jgi:glutamate/tyrosine decarboxylase-like PLP-dependent enzyme
MQIAASYLPSAGDGPRNPSDYVPELSRRARGFATWVMIRHLGRNGIAEIVSRNCACARRFAEKLGAESGVEILNDVVLNQVAVRFGTDDQTKAVIARIQQGGVAFVGGSECRGRWIMRISVISQNTTEADVDRSVKAMLEAWREVRGRN